MNRRFRIWTVMVLLTAMVTVSFAQDRTKVEKKDKQSSRGVSAQAATTPVTGSGTSGRLTKWLGPNGSSVIGDTIVFEDKFGNIGIGTDTPTSKLTVNGTVEARGGIKFGDGTQVTTAGVAHDTTLRGDGSTGNPLGLAVPLIFTGSVDNGNGVITVTNTAAGAPGLFATGGNSSPTVGGGSGVISLGGSGTNNPGGAGLVSFGGNANAGTGGTGASLIGGVGTNTGNGGDGLFAVGALGTGAGKKGGRGIVAIAGGGASSAMPGLAGDFVGDVEISGNLSKGGGSFKIDHPLDPENKYLYHSFVESPDMMNIYNGNVTTDEDGTAVVTLPDWFEALNKDFRYQLTVVGTFAQAIVGEKVKGNRFTIKTNAPGVEVSWQVTGIRKDAYANRHRIPVEELKSAGERGFFLHPEAFDQPEEKGVAFARSTEMMLQNKEAATRAEQAKKPAANKQ